MRVYLSLLLFLLPLVQALSTCTDRSSYPSSACNQVNGCPLSVVTTELVLNLDAARANGGVQGYSHGLPCDLGLTWTDVSPSNVVALIGNTCDGSTRSHWFLNPPRWEAGGNGAQFLISGAGWQAVAPTQLEARSHEFWLSGVRSVLSVLGPQYLIYTGDGGNGIILSWTNSNEFTLTLRLANVDTVTTTFAGTVLDSGFIHLVFAIGAWTGSQHDYNVYLNGVLYHSTSFATQMPAVATPQYGIFVLPIAWGEIRSYNQELSAASVTNNYDATVYRYHSELATTCPGCTSFQNRRTSDDGTVCVCDLGFFYNSTGACVACGERKGGNRRLICDTVTGLYPCNTGYTENIYGVCITLPTNVSTCSDRSMYPSGQCDYLSGCSLAVSQDKLVLNLDAARAAPGGALAYPNATVCDQGLTWQDVSTSNLTATRDNRICSQPSWYSDPFRWESHGAAMQIASGAWSVVGPSGDQPRTFELWFRYDLSVEIPLNRQIWQSGSRVSDGNEFSGGIVVSNAAVVHMYIFFAASAQFFTIRSPGMTPQATLDGLAWNHFVLTVGAWSGSSTLLHTYLNGYALPVNSMSLHLDTFPGPLIVNNFDALFDYAHFRVYTRALSASDVTGNYEATIHRFHPSLATVCPGCTGLHQRSSNDGTKCLCDVGFYNNGTGACFACGERKGVNRDVLCNSLVGRFPCNTGYSENAYGICIVISTELTTCSDASMYPSGVCAFTNRCPVAVSTDGLILHLDAARAYPGGALAWPNGTACDQGLTWQDVSINNFTGVVTASCPFLHWFSDPHRWVSHDSTLTVSNADGWYEASPLSGSARTYEMWFRTDRSLSTQQLSGAGAYTYLAYYDNSMGLVLNYTNPEQLCLEVRLDGNDAVARTLLTCYPNSVIDSGFMHIVFSIDAWVGYHRVHTFLNGLPYSTFDVPFYAQRAVEEDTLGFLLFTIPLTWGEFRFYNRALSVVDVASNYAATVHRYHPDLATVCPGCLASEISSNDGTTCACNTAKGYYNESNGVCALCLPGTFNNGSACAACAPGTFSDSIGVTSCSACPPGSIQPDFNSVSCTACPIDTFSQDNQCTPCRYRSYSSEGSANCTACPVGTGESVPGNPCVPCGMGLYGISIPYTSDVDVYNVSDGCYQCPEGTTSLQTGASIDACQPCPVGFGVGPSPDLTYSLCVPCLEGEVSIETVQSSADVYHTLVSGTQCYPCPQGTYQTGPGSSNNTALVNLDTHQFVREGGFVGCTNCSTQTDPNSYCLSTNGSYVCIPPTLFQPTLQRCDCALGTFGLACSACPPKTDPNTRCLDGFRGNGSLVCNAGMSFQNGLCNCAPGFYGPNCIPCGDQDQQVLYTHCLDGVNGTGAYVCDSPLVLLSGMCECAPDAVGVGRYCNQTCSNCPAATSQCLPSDDHPTCTCLPNFFRLMGMNSSDCNCNAGVYGINCTSTCSASCFSRAFGTCLDGYLGSGECACGMHRSLNSSSDACECATLGREGYHCAPCLPGSANNNLAQPLCQACQPGTFAALPGQSTCRACPAGSISSSANATGCVLCGEGKAASTDGLSVCTQCVSPTGTNVGALGTITCQGCEVGKALGSLGLCQNCTNGFYSNLTGLTQCLSCTAGRFSTNQPTPHSTCGVCSAGSYSAAEAASCTPCLEGSYSGSSESSECLACPSGKVAPVAGASACASCAAGRHKVSALLCTSCLAGTASAGGEDACSECQPGTFASGLENTQCFTCADGSYTNQTRATQCTRCDAGFTTNSVSGHINCTAIQVIVVEEPRLYSASPNRTSTENATAEVLVRQRFEFTVTVEGDLASIVSLDAFMGQLAYEIALAANTTADKVVITSVRPGSIIVDFNIPLTPAQVFQQLVSTPGLTYNATTYPILSGSKTVLVPDLVGLVDPDIVITRFSSNCSEKVAFPGRADLCDGYGACRRGMCVCGSVDNDSYCATHVLSKGYTSPTNVVCVQSGGNPDVCESQYTTGNRIDYLPSDECRLKHPRYRNVMPLRRYCQHLDYTLGHDAFEAQAIFGRFPGMECDGCDGQEPYLVYTLHFPSVPVANTATGFLLQQYAYVTNLYQETQPLLNKRWAWVESRYKYNNDTYQLSRLVFLPGVEGDPRWYYASATWHFVDCEGGEYAVGPGECVCQLNHVRHPITGVCTKGCDNGKVGPECDTVIQAGCQRDFNVYTAFLSYDCTSVVCKQNAFEQLGVCIPYVSSAPDIRFLFVPSSDGSSALAPWQLAVSVIAIALSAITVCLTLLNLMRKRWNKRREYTKVADK